MSSFKLWLIGLLLLFIATIAQPEYEEKEQVYVEESEIEEPDDPFVVVLTEENFGEIVSSNVRTLVEFYAPWCGHCKALAPKYAEAARILSEETESETILAKIDATQAPRLSEQFKIEGYPTLVLIDGKETIPFDGGRDTQQIVDWVLKHDIPAYQIMTNKEFESSRDIEIDLESEPKREYEIFGFVKKGSKREILFNSFCNELRGEKVMTFYKIYIKKKNDFKIVMRRNNKNYFSDEKLDGEYEVSYNGKMAPSKKSRKSVFTFTEYDLGTWMHEHRLPFFINLDDRESTNPNGVHPYSILYNSPKVPRGGIILIRIPQDDADAVKKLKEELIDTARELRADKGYMIVLTSKSVERIGFTEDVNMLLIEKVIARVPKLPSGYEAPQGDPNRGNPGSMFAQQYEQQSGMKAKETMREYRYQYDGDNVDNESLKKFVKDCVVDKRKERWLRSSDVTESAEDIHYDIITANTFKDIVLDKSSDVLVLYCTSWGRYCSPFMEEYNKLAKHVKTYYKNKSIKITYLDCDENDVDDVRVQAFPTMILYPGGTNKMDKGKLLSQQQRTMDDIIDFIDEFATSLDGKDEL